MRHLVVYITLFTFCTNLYSQSSPVYSNYLISSEQINPALYAFDNNLKLNLAYIRQWSNISHSPYALSVTADLRLGKYNFYNPKMLLNTTRFKSLERVGISGGLFNEVKGPLQKIGAQIGYSYHLPVNNSNTLSFGITGMVNHHEINYSILSAADPGDPLLSFDEANRFNANLGFRFSAPTYYLGLSMIHIFNDEYYSDNYAQPAVFLQAGYRYTLEERKYLLEPVFLSGYNLSEQAVFMNYYLKIRIPKYGWLGYGYLTHGQHQVSIALRVYKSFYLAYNFTSTSKNMNAVSYGGHGINIIGYIDEP